MQDYVKHLEAMLSGVDRGIEKAKARFEQSETAEKVKALAELAELRIRHDDLTARIAEAKEKGSEEWSSLRTGFQEEADGLKDTLEIWLTKLS